jgi:DivIVA domain-containing protein
MSATRELLTPERVRSVTFTTTRLGRRGVDEAEVRAFCEWAAAGVGRLRTEKDLLEAEVSRLRERLLQGKGNQEAEQPGDVHLQAVSVLSKAQQTADRCVADAQDYSRELVQEARLRRDELLREAKVRAAAILEEARTSAADSDRAREAGAMLGEAERQGLDQEIAYLRTFSDVCRTHLRAYLESLTRSVEEWERAERAGLTAVRKSAARALVHCQHELAGGAAGLAGLVCLGRVG